MEAFQAEGRKRSSARGRREHSHAKVERSTGWRGDSLARSERRKSGAGESREGSRGSYLRQGWISSIKLFF